MLTGCLKYSAKTVCVICDIKDKCLKKKILLLCLRILVVKTGSRWEVRKKGKFCWISWEFLEGSTFTGLMWCQRGGRADPRHVLLASRTAGAPNCKCIRKKSFVWSVILKWVWSSGAVATSQQKGPGFESATLFGAFLCAVSRFCLWVRSRSPPQSKVRGLSGKNLLRKNYM